MKTFIQELVKIQIDNKNHTFNGFASSEEYTRHLVKLFQSADMSRIVDERYARVIKTQLNDFLMALDAYLPMYQTTVDSMAHDAMYNSNLKEEVEWYKMLLNIRGIKEYYYQELMKILSPNAENDEETIKEEKNIEQTKTNLIKGVEAIGEVLGCKKTKAQAILNTGFLDTYQVGYYLGRTPVLEIEKWNKLPLELKSKICK